MMDKEQIAGMLSSLKDQIGQLEAALGGEGEEMMSEEGMEQAPPMPEEMPAEGGEESGMEMLTKKKMGQPPAIVRRAAGMN